MIELVHRPCDGGKACHAMDIRATRKDPRVHLRALTNSLQEDRSANFREMGNQWRCAATLGQNPSQLFFR